MMNEEARAEEDLVRFIVAVARLVVAFLALLILSLGITSLLVLF
jgi:hypothetical protein